MEKYSEGFEDYFDTMKDKDKTNSVIIAGKDFAVYNQRILNLLQGNDQIEINVPDRFVEKAIYIIKQWEAVGVTPQRNKYNPEGRIVFIETEEDIILRKPMPDGKNKYKEHVKKIILTKDPNLYRFTRMENWEQEELEEAKRSAK
ncbi:conserved hypothetical protein [Azospirillaceae bacterium]